MTTKTTPAAKVIADSNIRCGGGGQTSTSAKAPHDGNAQRGAGAQTSPAPTAEPSARQRPARGTTRPQQPKEPTPVKLRPAAVAPTSPPSKNAPHRNVTGGGGDQTDPPAPTGAPTAIAVAVRVGPWLREPMLVLLADVVADLEAVRCANENRLRTLTTPAGQLDKDGKSRGFGLTLANDDVGRMAATVAMLKCDSDVLKELGWHRPPKERGKTCCLEHQAILDMNRAMRRHPLWEWAKPLTGVGEKQFARLLGCLGDPYWNDLYDRPRTVRELRAYCGWAPGDDGMTRKRQRGQKSNWSDDAKKRSWLIAVSLMKQKGRYRDVYEAARKQYADTVHPTSCVRCGPSGKPAPVGSPRSPGHQHQMALRKVAVELLNDLWREAARLHRHTEPSPVPIAAPLATDQAARGTEPPQQPTGLPPASVKAASVEPTSPPPIACPQRKRANGGGDQTSTSAKMGSDSNSPYGAGAQTSPAPIALATADGEPARGTKPEGAVA